jgi:hypothetical protein
MPQRLGPGLQVLAWPRPGVERRGHARRAAARLSLPFTFTSRPLREWRELGGGWDSEGSGQRGVSWKGLAREQGTRERGGRQRGSVSAGISQGPAKAHPVGPLVTVARESGPARPGRSGRSRPPGSHGGSWDSLARAGAGCASEFPPATLERVRRPRRQLRAPPPRRRPRQPVTARREREVGGGARGGGICGARRTACYGRGAGAAKRTRTRLGLRLGEERVQWATVWVCVGVRVGEAGDERVGGRATWGALRGGTRCQ